jgi:hypothetical protein
LYESFEGWYPHQSLLEEQHADDGCGNAKQNVDGVVVR